MRRDYAPASRPSTGPALICAAAEIGANPALVLCDDRGMADVLHRPRHQVAVDRSSPPALHLACRCTSWKAPDTLTYAQVEAMLGEFLAYAMARIPDDQQEGFLRDVRSIRPLRR